MLKKLTTYFGWAGLAVILAISTAYLTTIKTKASPMQVGSATAKHQKPLTYFFVLEESFYNLDGSKITDQGQDATLQIAEGQRADGAHFQKMWRKTNPQRTSTRIDLPSVGKTVVITGDVKTTMGDGKPRDPMREAKYMNYDTCGIVASDTGFKVANETIQGFKAIHTTVKESDGTIADRWIAPAFDCREIKTVLQTANSRTTIDPLILTTSTPDDGYFTVDAKLKEMDPAAARQSLGGSPFPAGKEAALIEDYTRDKAARGER